MAVVQYTFTHKQYTEQHIRHKQYIERHNSLIRKSADRAPSFRGIPWHLPYNWGKSTVKPQSGYMSIRIHVLVFISLRGWVKPRTTVRAQERMNNLSDSTVNRARELSVCRAVLQPTASPRTLMQLFTCRPTVRCDVSEVASSSCGHTTEQFNNEVF